MGSDVVRFSMKCFTAPMKIGEVVLIVSTSESYPTWWKPWTWRRRPIDGRFKVVAVTKRKVTLTAVAPSPTAPAAQH